MAHNLFSPEFSISSLKKFFYLKDLACKILSDTTLSYPQCQILIPFWFFPNFFLISSPLAFPVFIHKLTHCLFFLSTDPSRLWITLVTTGTKVSFLHFYPQFVLD